MSLSESEPPTSKPFGERLRTLRKKRYLTQRQLAALLKVTPSAVCYWEGGRSAPRPLMMVRLAGILHTSFDYLATGAHSSEEHGEPSEVIARARQDVASAFGLDVSQVRIVLTDEGEELAA